MHFTASRTLPRYCPASARRNLHRDTSLLLSSRLKRGIGLGHAPEHAAIGALAQQLPLIVGQRRGYREILPWAALTGLDEAHVVFRLGGELERAVLQRAPRDHRSELRGIGLLGRKVGKQPPRLASRVPVPVNSGRAMIRLPLLMTGSKVSRHGFRGRGMGNYERSCHRLPQDLDSATDAIWGINGGGSRKDGAPGPDITKPPSPPPTEPDTETDSDEVTTTPTTTAAPGRRLDSEVGPEPGAEGTQQQAGPGTGAEISSNAPGAAPESPIASPAMTSPPYWMHHNGPRHDRTASNASVESIPTGGITLRDNETSSVDERGSACWARSVQVTDYVVVNGSATSVGAFVVYNIRVETLNGSYMNIRKRYSEFDDFRWRLIRTFPGFEAAVPELPPKSIISKFRPKFLEKRRAGLQYFLKYASRGLHRWLVRAILTSE
ncbi:hypothetical protein DL762_003055 [Monosporascus cannonballus]|uniref:Endosomal/vacuolar adapter protein YPT35 n=1 Tax=Monosporascus cannonballus TaxID=155416 RepID=A0ABY0HCA7_9PEZI|nr:hypothetical protein DL762_003055 [Monosporascus cannonballus]